MNLFHVLSDILSCVVLLYVAVCCALVTTGLLTYLGDLVCKWWRGKKR
jgi:hypothetical protein